MKKAIVTSIFLLLAIFASAQITVKPGIKAGINITKITNFDDDSQTSFYGGIFGELKFGGVEAYSLQPEIVYSKQGSKNIQLEFISIVIANKFYFFKNKLPLYIVLAPSFDINIHDDLIYQNEIDGEADIQGWEFSVAGGLGYDFPFGLTIDARFKRGVNDFTQTTTNYRDTKRVNTAIQIGAAYKFDFKK